MKPEPINFTQERRRRRPEQPTLIEEALQRDLSEALPQPEAKREPEPKKGPRCSCCERPQEKTNVLLSLEGRIFLCNGCLEVCNAILSEEGISTAMEPERNSTTSTPHRRTQYYCSFCGRELAQVARLIAMLNKLFICNKCVGTCNSTIAQTPNQSATSKKPEPRNAETIVSTS